MRIVFETSFPTDKEGFFFGKRKDFLQWEQDEKEGKSGEERK